ncbi:MAG: hypothetical protein ACRDAU_16305 [Clostridium sp.]
MSAGLTLSTKSIYSHNGKKYNIVKTLSTPDLDFILVKCIEDGEELKVTAGQFRDTFKLEQYLRGKTFFL